MPGTDQISIVDKVPPKELTIAERLTDVLKKCHHLSNSPADDNGKVAIKREMAFHQSTGQRGKLLESLYKALMTIPPTTIDAERAFSASGLFMTRLRSRLCDDTLSKLTLLKFYLEHVDDSIQLN